MTQAPGNPSYQTTVTVRVSYHTITGNCNVNPSYPDTSTFTFTVNGVDRRNYFTIADTVAIATALPLTNLATNALVATITGFDGFVITQTSSVVTYVDTKPLPAVYTTSVNYDDQDMSRCAVDCFAAAYSQSTIPYVSMDTPRNVTLVYHGDRVAPRPFILIEMEHPAGATLPTDFRFEAKLNGTSITFLNLEQVLHFQPAYGRLRIGGQFDASGYATAVYPLQIIVTSLYGSDLRQTVINTKLTVVNEAQSLIARGWTVRGLQRLYVQGDGSLLITDGTGSATYFAKVCNPTCAYLTPPGDFTKLVDLSPSGWERRAPDSTKMKFDNTGRLVAIRDRFGNLDSMTYSSGRLWMVRDPTGRNTVLGYGANGLASIRDPMNRFTYVTVASDSTLRVIKDPDGDSTRFVYDANRRLQQIDRQGAISRFVYDSKSWKIDSLILPAIPINGGASESPKIGYSAWQSVGVPSDSTSGSHPPYSGVLVDSVSARITDAEGHATRLFVDRWGQPTKVLDPLSTPTSISYEGNGLPTQVIQFSAPNQVTESATWNAQGSLTTHSGTAIPTTYVNYGSYAQPDSVWGSDGSASRAFLGTSGRVDSVRIAGQDSIKFRYTYDAQGRMLTAKDPLAHITRYHYDASFGNQDSVLAPGNRFTRIRFDQYGRDSASSGTSTPWRRKIYDVLNRLVQFYDGVNANPTSYGYDKLFLTRVQDPKDQVYRFATTLSGSSLNASIRLTRSTDTTAIATTATVSPWDGRIVADNR